MKRLRIRYLVVVVAIGGLLEAIIERQCNVWRATKAVERAEVEAARFALRLMGSATMKAGDRVKVARRYIRCGMSIQDVVERAGEKMSLVRMRGRSLTHRYEPWGLEVSYVDGVVVAVSAVEYGDDKDVLGGPKHLTSEERQLLLQECKEIVARGAESGE